MDLNTTLYDCLVRHPEIESVQDIPAEDRRAILVALEHETEPELLVAMFHGAGWDADEHENRLYEQYAAATWRAINGNADDVAERDRLAALWLWHVSESQIEEALQDVRAEEAA